MEHKTPLMGIDQHSNAYHGLDANDPAGDLRRRIGSDHIQPMYVLHRNDGVTRQVGYVVCVVDGCKGEDDHDQDEDIAPALWVTLYQVTPWSRARED